MRGLTVREEIEKRKLIAVLTIGDSLAAVPVAKALYEGGVRAVEITLRTPRAFESIRLIRKEFPEMLVGAGTVLGASQISRAIEVGAQFAVSTGTKPSVIKAAAEEGLFFIPGIFTPSDIEVALENGCTLLKYFPAFMLGMEHLRSIATPYRHLGVKFIPSGCMNEGSLKKFASDSLVAAVAGSWLATPEQVDMIHTAKISAQAKSASDIIKSV